MNWFRRFWLQIIDPIWSGEFDWFGVPRVREEDKFVCYCGEYQCEEGYEKCRINATY